MPHATVGEWQNRTGEGSWTRWKSPTHTHLNENIKCMSLFFYRYMEWCRKRYSSLFWGSRCCLKSGSILRSYSSSQTTHLTVSYCRFIHSYISLHAVMQFFLCNILKNKHFINRCVGNSYWVTSMSMFHTSIFNNGSRGNRCRNFYKYRGLHQHHFIKSYLFPCTLGPFQPITSSFISIP